MATLDAWRHLLRAPQTMAFARLALLGEDHAPTVAEGVGEVQIESLTHTSYRFMARPADPLPLLAAIRRHEADPYDGRTRMRLVGEDTEGRDWTLGWTLPRIELGAGDWVFSGELEALMSHDSSETVARDTTTEVLFPVPPEAPMHWVMDRVVPQTTVQGDPEGLEFTVLESRIRVAFDRQDHALSIVATRSSGLPTTYAENWLGEPLRILFGQLVYPRLVARNFGDGRSMVSIRPSPGYQATASWAALWRGGGDPRTLADRFWSAYRAVLTYVAQGRDEGGQPNFESNPITRLYEEIVLASWGSKWVWALTFASAIEAMVRVLYPRGTRHPEADAEAERSLIRHIEQWQGPQRLRDIARGAVERSSDLPIILALRALRDEEVVTTAQIKAWQALRNDVMHGQLVERYSTEREDAKLLALAGLFHALAARILGLPAAA